MNDGVFPHPPLKSLARMPAPGSTDADDQGPLAALRRFVRSPKVGPVKERCEFCSAPLGAEHQHLIDPPGRRMICACDACAVLFDRPGASAYVRVPQSGRLLTHFLLPDDVWDELALPINLAFFFFSTPAGRIVALYPSPAGPTESLLPLSAWDRLVEINPVLGSLQRDVEALLVNRLGARRSFARDQFYLAPIDACYELVGLVRRHWRGLGGGSDVWQELQHFFARLETRSRRDDRRPATPAESRSSHRSAEGARDA